MVQETMNFGARLRDQGIKQVSDNNKLWMETCLRELESMFFIFADLPDFTGEDIRKYCENSNLIPTNPHAWGALTKALIARKLIVKTGNYVMPKDSSSHGRMIQEYRRTS